MPQCTAKSKRTHEQCQQPAMHGSTKCYMHGGKTPKGIASPNLKTGRYSRYLPTQLLEAYEQSQSDDELLNIRDDVALIDSMIAANLPKLETRESGKAWQMIKKTIGDLREAFANENYGGCLVLVDVMVDIVNERMLYYATEQEIRSSLDQRRKLAESERKRLIEMNQVVTSEQAMLLVTGLLESVRRNVENPDTLNAIQSDFVRLTTYQNSPRISVSTETEE